MILGSESDGSVRFFNINSSGGTSPQTIGNSNLSNYQRMIIANNGNVGIGTPSPTQLLDVNGKIALGYNLATSNQVVKTFATAHSAANVPYQLDFTAIDGFTDSLGTGAGMSIRGFRDGSANSQSLLFATHHGGISAGVRMVIDKDGNVGIGTTQPAYLLSVKGTIGAQEVVVTNNVGPDYVFDDNYRLAPLREVAEFVQANHHLPGIPSAAQEREKGMGLGDMENRLLEKIEELTLHMIAAEKRTDGLQEMNRELRTENAELRRRIAAVEEKAQR